MTDFEMKLLNPPKKYRPIPFWSWNEKLNINETKSQIREMEKAGIGGFFIHARGGLQTEYLGKEWFDNVSAAIDESEKTGMFAYGYDENGWPSGFGNGAVNGLGLKYQQKFLRCAVIDEPIEDEFTLINVEVDGKIYHVYYEVDPSYVDTLNGEVIGEFLKSTHEKYRDELKDDFKKLKGFFTDEPQVSRNGIPWSFHLEKEYEKLYGESIRQHLPKLFYRIDGYEHFRFNFWKLVRDLFSDGYMGTICKWCQENGSSLTGHMVLEEDYYEHILANGCCMPSYEFMDIPGMDHLCRIMPSVQAEMQLVSVANQLGKKQILSETFAGCGWNVSFEDMRKLHEHQMVHGVNLLCQHLEGYSLRGIRKRDYPASLYRQQPWWKDYRIFNDTVSRIGMLLADGNINFKILVLHTVESGWLTIDDRNETDGYARKMLEVMNTLEENQLQYHLGESRIIQRHGSVNNGKFIIGTQSYSVVIVPPSRCLDENTFHMLCDFRNQGGTVIFTQEIPGYINGNKSDKVKELAKECIKCGVENLTEYISQDCQFVSVGYTDNRKHHFIRSNVRRFENEKMTMYYLCNFGDDAEEITVTVKGKSVKLFDAVSGTVKPTVFKNEGNKLTVKNTVYPNSNIILFVYDENVCSCVEECCFAESKIDISDKLKGKWKIAKSDLNSITLDYCDLYVNGKKIADNIPISDVQERLCAFGKKIDVNLVFEFEIRDLSFGVCNLMVETPELFDIYLNGDKVENTVIGYCHDTSFKIIDVFKYLKFGKNELHLKCDFLQSEEVYQDIKDAMKFVSVMNKLTYDMEIEAVYLKGDFGVYTDEKFVAAGNGSIQTAGGFYLGKAPETVTDGTLETLGYPFFAGSITLSKKFILTENETKNAVISFAKLPSIVTDICVNGKSAGKILWKPYSVDISEFVKRGENQIQITLTGSLRNLLGPAHLNEGEAHMVLPFYFFRKTNIWGWGDGNNPEWTDNYSFVQNGLFI